MLNQNNSFGFRRIGDTNRSLPFFLLTVSLLLTMGIAASAQSPFREHLKTQPFKIAYESYVNDNWDIFVMNADGSNPVNLTHTPKVHEMYPQISPDGSKICFVVDSGEGRETVRSVYLMDIDGTHRRKIADYARQPFWRHDGRVIGFLPQEYPKFNVIDYFTHGISFYHLDTGKIEPHVNGANLHHLYNPNFSPDGKWIVATVHAGMGLSHAILLIEAHGTNVINLHIPGCRPCLSPDGKQIAWGAGDHEIAAAPINLDSAHPTVGKWREQIKDEKNKIYHVDWSPDGKFLSFSRGPDGKGDPTKSGTFEAACEIVGVYAPGWNICAVSAQRDGVLDLNHASPADFAMLTTNGASDKESAWFRPSEK